MTCYFSVLAAEVAGEGEGEGEGRGEGGEEEDGDHVREICSKTWVLYCSINSKLHTIIVTTVT